MKFLMLLFLAFLVAGCDAFGTKGQLDRISRRHDPASLELEPAFNDYVQRTFLPGGVELGVVELKDGSGVKYWFRSHHRSDDMGGAWFEFETGERFFVEGGFCCEVQLPSEQLQSSEELRQHLAVRDGVRP